MAKPKLSQEQRITLAQLQALEGTYTGLTTSFESAKSEARTSRGEYNRLVGEIEELKGEIEEEDNEVTRQTLRARLAEKNKELNKLKDETTVKQATKAQLRTNIDRSIEDIKSLPGVKEAIQEILAKKYDKEIEKLGKQKEKEEKVKKNIEKIAELTDEGKTENALEFSDSFKDMLDAKNQIKKLDAKIDELQTQITNTTDEAVRHNLVQQRDQLKNNDLPNARTRYQTAKTKFMNLSRAADVEFEEAEVDHIAEVVNNGIKRRQGRENDYDLGKVLKKQISKTGKNIESLDAQAEEFKKGKTTIGQDQQQGQPGQGGPNGGDQQKKLHFWNPFHWRKMYQRHKQKKLEAAKQEEQQGQDEQSQTDNDIAHKAFVRELQRNSTIDAIVNREMRETRDRAADVRRSYEEDKDK